LLAGPGGPFHPTQTATTPHHILPNRFLHSSLRSSVVIPRARFSHAPPG